MLTLLDIFFGLLLSERSFYSRRIGEFWHVWVLGDVSICLYKVIK